MMCIRILRRIVASVPLIIGVVLVVFIFMRLTPGDPVDIMMGHSGNVSTQEIDSLRNQFHLDQPLAVQVKDYLLQVAHGDLGTSFKMNKPVLTLIFGALPATVEQAVVPVWPPRSSVFPCRPSGWGSC